MPHLRPARASAARPRSRPHFTRADFDDARRARAIRRARSTSPPTNSRICRSSRSTCSATSCGPAPGRSPSRRTAASEKAVHRSDAARGSRRGAPVASLDDVDAAVAELGLPLVLKTRRYGYDGKGQAWIRSARRSRGGLGRDRRRARGRRSRRRLRRRILGHPRALGRRPPRLLGLARERASRGHPAPLDRPVQRRSSRAQVEEARERGAAHRRGARPCRRADRRVLRQRRRARWSTRSRRASTTAATGRSRARSPRSSSSTSARSAACRPGSTGARRAAAR